MCIYYLIDLRDQPHWMSFSDSLSDKSRAKKPVVVTISPVARSMARSFLAMRNVSFRKFMSERDLIF